MSEGLLARARRVVEAGVGSVVETAERLTGTGLMRQAIRDVEAAMEQLKKHQATARQCRMRAAEREHLATERAAKLREEARFALVAGREDLAQAAVAEKQRAEQDAATAAADAARATQDERRCGEALAEVEARHRALIEELRAHEAIAAAGQPLPAKVDRKVVRAEESFARALATGGCAPAGDASAARVAEIATMRREQAIADEVAALRAGLDAPAAPPKRARRA